MRELERSLGLPGVIAVSVSAMLGSGIFVLPGLAAARAGEALWLAYLIAALCALPAALCKAELATAMPVAGGTYVYVDRTFGPLAGTLVTSAGFVVSPVATTSVVKLVTTGVLIGCPARSRSPDTVTV